MFLAFVGLVVMEVSENTSGYELAKDIAENNNAWTIAFRSENYIKFKVNARTYYLDDAPHYDGWEIEQWRDGPSTVIVAYSVE